ncbi:ABC transporter ATP-binding protein [Camelliibacillus cellulosilyticus]|uniref:ABC transporter ATP-binding protein n=1 Tax=Camelliibacillus cellulosilyticus TaxID=2174486 RepID=A0ABV9GN68_9BACL
MPETLLKVENLQKYYPVTGGVFGRRLGDIKAVDGISFSMFKGETLGIVGESGCGKSTTGRLIMRLIEPSAGTITFEGVDLGKLSKSDMRKRRKDIQMVFQDPYSSLNPRHRVGKILEQPLRVHQMAKGRDVKTKVQELLETVGLDRDAASRYPHQFSGGQRQRIGIARALAAKPKLIIADEPVSALDVSIQSQVLNLLKDLQQSFQLTYLFISHDLGVVRHISDRVGVMYLGRIVELATSDQLYERPKHPYTQALLSAVPVADPDHKQERIILSGDVPNPAHPPQGCAFHTRCPMAMDICKMIRPKLMEDEPGHSVACHLYETTEMKPKADIGFI